MEKQYPTLKQFLSAYFHEDWPEEAPDWPHVVELYLKHASARDVSAVVAEIHSFLLACPSDPVLEERLLRQLGCYYTPRPDIGGPSVRSWLVAVASHLRK